jgi:cell division protein FtsB
MTARILAVLKIACLLAVLFLCTTLGFLALHIDKTVRDSGPKVTATLDSLHQTIDKTHVTVDKVNTNLNDLDADIKYAYKVETEARIAALSVNRAALKEQFYFEKQLPSVLDDVRKVLTTTAKTLTSVSDSQARIADKASEVLDTTNETIAATKPVLANLEKSTADLDRLINSPDIVDTLHNINETTTSGAHIAKDVEHEVHTLVYPKPIIVAGEWALKIIHAAGGWFHP